MQTCSIVFTSHTLSSAVTNEFDAKTFFYQNFTIILYSEKKGRIQFNPRHIPGDPKVLRHFRKTNLF